MQALLTPDELAAHQAYATTVNAARNNRKPIPAQPPEVAAVMAKLQADPDTAGAMAHLEEPDIELWQLS